jgi:hypothetical protein
VHVPRRSYRPLVDQRLDATARGVLAELEVDQVDDPGLGRRIQHAACFGCRPTEGLVAHDVPAVLERPHDVLTMEERRRVDRDEVDRCGAGLLHPRRVAG